MTGSVSRGVADDISDIEMLVVTGRELELEDCFALAAACGLTDLGTWGPQGGPTRRVSGYRDGVPVELMWWSCGHAESTVDAIVAGAVTGSADALANGVALRTSGCWRNGRSDSGTTRTSSPALRSRTRRSPGEGSHPRGF